MKFKHSIQLAFVIITMVSCKQKQENTIVSEEIPKRMGINKYRSQGMKIKNSIEVKQRQHSRPTSKN